MRHILWAGLLIIIAIVNKPGVAQDDAEYWQLVEIRTTLQRYGSGEISDMTADEAARVASSISLDDPATWRMYVEIGDLIAQVYYHYLPVADRQEHSPMPTTHQITFDGSAAGPQWSPDGQRILFYSAIDGDYEIYVMNADGSNRQQLTNNLSDEFEPVWSPESRWVAFTSDQDGETNIWMMTADGFNQQRLTYNGTGDSNPLWRNDGTGIIFNANHDGDGEIYSIDIEDFHIQQLTDNTVDDISFDVASTTGEILLTSKRNSGDFALYTMDANGGDVRQLPQLDGYAWDGDWSPDGTKIVFQMQYDLHILDVNTGEKIQLTANDRALGELQPDWSPDGQQIAFAALKDGTYDIYIMDLPAGIIGITPSSDEDEHTPVSPSPADQTTIEAVVQEMLNPTRTIIDAPELARMAVDQQTVLDEFGPPDSFTRMVIPDVNGTWMQYDMWTYFDAYTAFIFLDGVFLRSEFVQRPGNVEPTPYLPTHFLLGMPFQIIVNNFPDELGWANLTDMEDLLTDYGAPAELWATDRLLLGFVDDKLVFVQAMAFANEEGIG